MLVVAALGGNALLKRGEPMTAETQRMNVRVAVASLAPLVRAGHRLVITHGNGPQVGLLALQAAAGPPDGHYPLDMLDAQSEGMIGYVIEQELRNALAGGPEVATLLTQIRVDADDPAFARPTKPIGRTYDGAEARRLAATRGWSVAPDGDGWRRVVPSPAPIDILEAHVIALLVGHGITVICAGGGGVPVIMGADGALAGVEAVIDKDHASGLLARTLGADVLLLLTDVDAVYTGWGTGAAVPIGRVHPDDLDPSEFAEGSMRPKVEASARFALETGKPAVIGRLDQVAGLITGRSGTTITTACEPGTRAGATTGRGR